MKILAVHPGASFSTHDVYVGLTEGLRERGHEVWEYALDCRIERAGAWLNYCWHRTNRDQRKAKVAADQLLPKPNSSDILYKASAELIERALRINKEDDPLDVVLVVSAMYLHPDIFVLLRRAGIRVAVLFTESPYDDERQQRILPFLNVAWTNERSSARAGVKYLPAAFRTGVHVPDGPDDATIPSHDVVFVGTGFQERLDMLQAVDWSGIDLGLYGDAWNLLGSRAKTRKYIRGGSVDNEATAILYRKAKIGLNLFRKSKGFGKHAPMIARAESLGPRSYELAATGCFTVSEHRKEVAEIFGPLVPTFETPQELGAVIRRWLADDEGRARVRAALPGVVRDHNWLARAEQVESDLRGAGIGASHAA